MSDATDVLHAIDQLRRDLSGYHGQLKARNDLQRHCDHQRERIVELEGLYAKAKAESSETAMAFSKEHDRAEFLMRENAKLRELVQDFDKCLTEAVRLAYIQGHMTLDDGTLLDSLHPRMRKLGIEVDG